MSVVAKKTRLRKSPRERVEHPQKNYHSSHSYPPKKFDLDTNSPLLGWPLYMHAKGSFSLYLVPKSPNIFPMLLPLTLKKGKRKKVCPCPLLF